MSGSSQLPEGSAGSPAMALDLEDASERLDSSADLDHDGPPTAEMPPVRVLRAPRPANRPAPGTARTSPEPEAPPKHTRPEPPPRRGRTPLLVVTGALVVMAIVVAVASQRAGLFPWSSGEVTTAAPPQSPPEAATTIETYDIAIGDVISADQPAAGAGRLASGEQEVFVFDGLRGQALFLTGPTCEARGEFAPGWTLTDPAGQQLGFGPLCGRSGSDPELPVLPETGTYRLGIHTTGEATGQFGFRLAAPPQPPTG